jgi:hypothetical protein
VFRELVESKSPQVLRELPREGEGWQVHYAFFARAESRSLGAWLVGLKRLDEGLKGR